MSEDLTQFDRRMTVKREDSTLSYSIPAGVTDETAAAEVARMERAIERGYTMKCSPDGPFGGGLRTDVRWIAAHPRLSTLYLYGLVVPSRAIPRAVERTYFWCKCRCLDVYWFVKDRFGQRTKQAPSNQRRVTMSTTAKVAALKAHYDRAPDFAVEKAFRGETLNADEMAHGTYGIPQKAFCRVEDAGWKLTAEALSIVSATAQLDQNGDKS